MKIAGNGSWLSTTNEGHCFDSQLAGAIVKFCREQGLSSILDLGCGDGSYVNFFNEETFELFAIGCDGNPNTFEIASKEKMVPSCWTAELHKPLTFNRPPADLILSLEIGEHIPAEFEDVYLDNVVKYAKDWIILSWAVPGQGGDGHVNCKHTERIFESMQMRGFDCSVFITGDMREQTSLPWFKDSLMVFKRIQ